MSNVQSAGCPRCGFSYGWDGNQCRHCKHGVKGAFHDEFVVSLDDWLASGEGAGTLMRVPRKQFTPRKCLLLPCGCLRSVVEQDQFDSFDPFFFPARNLRGWLAGAEAAADGDPSILDQYSSSIPGQKAHDCDREALARAVRDLFVYPFGPVPFLNNCVTPTVVVLAETIYARGSFEGLPVLCDALEEAGCTDKEVLRHCRHESCHFRGCWVLDLILAKD
jgi:hypothetical protein